MKKQDKKNKIKGNVKGKAKKEVMEVLGRWREVKNKTEGKVEEKEGG